VVRGDSTNRPYDKASNRYRVGSPRKREWGSGSLPDRSHQERNDKEITLLRIHLSSGTNEKKTTELIVHDSQLEGEKKKVFFPFKRPIQRRRAMNPPQG